MLVGSFVVVIVVGIAYKNDFCFVFFFFFWGILSLSI